MFFGNVIEFSDSTTLKNFHLTESSLMLYNIYYNASVVELVYTLVLEANAARIESSSLSTRTI